MERATVLSRRGSWPAHLARDRVTLPHDSRFRRRIRLVTDSGKCFLLDLPNAQVMRDGDGVRLETGEWVQVRAAPEALIEISCESETALTRVAWHLGNRHIPTQIVGGKLRVQDDAVVRTLASSLGARVEAIEAPFDPEGGAYDSHPREDN